MSKHHLAVAALAWTVLTVLACSAPTPTPTVPPKPTIEPTQPPVAPPTRPPLPGSISGRLCYPGSGIPPMTIYAVEQTTGRSSKVRSKGPTETRYRIEGVLPGTYVLYAWLDDGALGGSYSKAVPCGLSADCTDHSLIPVTVKTGQDVTGIDVCDWYGPPPPAPPQ
jgi:hypothetical protein